MRTVPTRAVIPFNGAAAVNGVTRARAVRPIRPISADVEDQNRARLVQRFRPCGAPNEDKGWVIDLLV